MSVLKHVVNTPCISEAVQPMACLQASHIQLLQAFPHHTFPKVPYPPESPCLSHKVVKHLLQFPGQL